MKKQNYFKIQNGLAFSIKKNAFWIVDQVNYDEGDDAADESRMSDEKSLAPRCIGRKILVGEFVSRTPALFWMRQSTEINAEVV